MNARAVTGDVSDITANTVKLAGKLSEFPADAESGIVVSGVEGDENVRAGVRIAGTTAADFNVLASGLLPGTTYYYAAYLDLGAGVVYGETKSFTTPDKAFDVDNDLVLTVPDCTGEELYDTVRHMAECFKALMRCLRDSKKMKARAPARCPICTPPLAYGRAAVTVVRL